MKKIDIKYIPVQMFVRIEKEDGKAGEKALLIARRDDGREFTFLFHDFHEEFHGLHVSDFESKDE